MENGEFTEAFQSTIHFTNLNAQNQTINSLEIDPSCQCILCCTYREDNQSLLWKQNQEGTMNALLTVIGCKG